MLRRTTLIKVGRSIVVRLPGTMARRMNLAAGDRVLAVETSDGILITPAGGDFERAMGIAERISGRYRNALRKLAK